MATSRSCSWCHTMNREEWQFCRTCGHEVHVPRLLCCCLRCSGDNQVYEAEEAISHPRRIRTTKEGVCGRARGG
jgi:hypothetical protein